MKKKYYLASSDTDNSGGEDDDCTTKPKSTYQSDFKWWSRTSCVDNAKKKCKVIQKLPPLKKKPPAVCFEKVNQDLAGDRSARREKICSKRITLYQQDYVNPEDALKMVGVTLERKVREKNLLTVESNNTTLDLKLRDYIPCLGKKAAKNEIEVEIKAEKKVKSALANRTYSKIVEYQLG